MPADKSHRLAVVLRPGTERAREILVPCRIVGGPDGYDWYYTQPGHERRLASVQVEVDGELFWVPPDYVRWPDGDRWMPTMYDGEG